MKRKCFIGLLLLLLMSVFAFRLVGWSGNCKTIRVQTRLEIYTEAQRASNRVAELQPGDVIYFCGD